jgi:hypothetical protein
MDEVMPGRTTLQAAHWGSDATCTGRFDVACVTQGSARGHQVEAAERFELACRCGRCGHVGPATSSWPLVYRPRVVAVARRSRPQCRNCFNRLADCRKRGLILQSIEHKRAERAQVPLAVTVAEVMPANRRVVYVYPDGAWPATPFAARAAHQDRVTVLEPGRDWMTKEVTPVRVDVGERKRRVVAG